VILPTLAGLAAGATHALSGPDHLAAVLPLAAESPERGPAIGLTWAAGHGLGTALLAAAAVAVRARLDLDWIGTRAELLVGIALIATGLWTLGRRHAPPHGHAHRGAALGLGTLHGVAGGTHALVVLSALALSPGLAAGWLLAFVLGAGVAMGGVGLALQRAGRVASAAWLARLRVGAGVTAVGVGAFWAARQLVG
jgi:hypothetical protein